MYNVRKICGHVETKEWDKKTERGKAGAMEVYGGGVERSYVGRE